MTRFPSISRQVVGVNDARYDTNPICAVPECVNQATDRHHLFSRGLMGGAFEWVKFEQDDKPIGNIVGLCSPHHREVTENKAWITFEGGVFWWNDVPLDWQPPGTTEVIRGIDPYSVTPSPDRGKCPACNRPLPKPKIEGEKMEKAKVRRTWSVSVPLDERENGADVIDSLLEACEEEMDKAGLSWGGGDRVNYYRLTAVLALFAQHGSSILDNE